MFRCDYKDLVLAFNAFHDVKNGDMPEYGSFCLLELRDGRLTGGSWHPKNYQKKNADGQFIRGTADTVPAEDVAKWHALEQYDLSECLQNENIGRIHFKEEEEGDYTVEIGHFKSFADRRYPKSEQYCLLVLKTGRLAVGRWDVLSRGKGTFIYAPALACYSMDKVWAWTALGPDDIFEREQEREKERNLERKRNRNPVADPELLRYGTDINVYYEKALAKLRAKYPWATVTQMRKPGVWEIVPKHGKYVFGQDEGTFLGDKTVREWKDGSTADEFIDFLCTYAEESVKNSNPEVKFSLGMDIEPYLEKAYGIVKAEYRWLDKKVLKEHGNCRFAIRQVDGDWEFTERYKGSTKDYVCECSSAESFIEQVANNYRDAALRANPVVALYEVPFGHVDAHGWNLERYNFYKLKTGDYKVYVQAGDRTTGGSREFFITPNCFAAKTYSEFLDRYLEIVPGSSFGLYKEDLLSNEDLRRFLGY